MGNYPEQVTVADFGTRVAGVRAHLATWSDEHRHIVDREDDDILDRVEALLDEVLVATSIQNEIVVPQGLVGSLTNAIVAVDAAVTALDAVDEETVTMPLINDLSNAAETLAANLFQWPPRIDGENWREAVTQAASTYRRSAGQQLAGLSAEIQAARAELVRIEQLSIDLANKTRELGDQVRRDLTEQLTALQNQLTSTNATVAAAGTQVQAAVDRSEAAIGTQQQQFAEAQEARSKEFAASLKQLVIDADGLIDAAANDAQTKVDRIDELMAKTEVLVDVFTAAGTARGQGPGWAGRPLASDRNRARCCHGDRGCVCARRISGDIDRHMAARHRQGRCWPDSRRSGGLRSKSVGTPPSSGGTSKAPRAQSRDLRPTV